MKNRTGDILCVFSAAAFALCLFFGVVLFTHGQAEIPLHADTARQLAELSFDTECASIDKQAEMLGPHISNETINARWILLKSEMQAKGMSSSAATRVLKAVAIAKCPTLKSSDRNPRLWPIFAKLGWVGNKKVVIVHLAYGKPPQALMGMFSKQEIRELNRAFRVYVISAQAPYRCWISPSRLESLPPEERSVYVGDNETASERQQLRWMQLYLEGQRKKYDERRRQYQRQAQYERWHLKQNH